MICCYQKYPFSPHDNYGDMNYNQHSFLSICTPINVYHIFLQCSWHIIFCYVLYHRCVNREYGYYGDPDDPKKYFVCMPYIKQRQGKSLGSRLGLGRKWEFTCGPGTTFSEKHSTCV